MVDINLVVTKLEQQNLLRTKKQVGSYMTCYCPFHNNGNEKKPSCGILLETQSKGGQVYPAGWWHCFSCGYTANLEEGISDILKNHELSGSGHDWLIANIPDYGVEEEFEYLIPKDTMEAVQNSYALGYIKDKTEDKVSYVPEEVLATYRYTVPYMYERKLTDPIIEKFDVGFDPNFSLDGKNGRKTPCITFPVHDENGNTLFIYRRSIENRFHNYPKGVLKPVYGLDQIPKGCKSVIICESIINALTLWSYGLVAVALMGTGNAYQLEQLKRLGVHEYIICLDGDEAGERGTAKLYRQLSHISLVWRIDMIKGEDVNSISKDTFFQLYNNKY